MAELRDLYAAALGHDVSATNLKRVLLRRGVLEPTGERRPPGTTGGRPAELYRFRDADASRSPTSSQCCARLHDARFLKCRAGSRTAARVRSRRSKRSRTDRDRAETGIVRSRTPRTGGAR